MENIQIGLDIATLLSVGGATYVYLRPSVKKRKLAISSRRIEYMSVIITDFIKLIEKGEVIIQEVTAMKSDREGNVTVDTYTNYCYELLIYVNVNLTLQFCSWATKEEMKIFNTIESSIKDWNDKFVTAANSRKKESKTPPLPIPSFDEFIKQLSKEVFKLSEILKKEIEKNNY